MSKILIGFVFLACTVFMFLEMRPTGNKLKTPQTPYGILELEFAYDLQHTSHVINAWQEDSRIAAAKTNTYLDFALIFFYSLFLFYSCRNLSNHFSGWLNDAGIWLSKAALVAGLLDVIENVCMLTTLNNYSSIFISMITSFCALIKWLLVILSVVYILFAGPVALFSKPKEADPF